MPARLGVDLLHPALSANLVHHQGTDFGALAWDRRHPCRPPLAGKDAGGGGPRAAARDGTPLQSNPSETALARRPLSGARVAQEDVADTKMLPLYNFTLPLAGGISNGCIPEPILCHRE